MDNENDNVESRGKRIGRLAEEFGKKTVEFASVAGKKTAEVAADAGKKTAKVAVKAKDGVVKSKDKMMEKMDVNGDGTVDIEDIIIMGLKTPGVRIKREAFLRKEFAKKYSDDIIEDAVAQNPFHAGMKVEDIDKIADEVIKYERTCVSGISAALGTPGGAAMVATIPADIAQYYGYLLRAAQKMLYLYGFPEISLDENNQALDTETLNVLVLCMGVMYGVAGANNAVKAMAKALANGVEKQLMKKALTKGTIYPIVKSVSKWFGVKMTKEVFAGFFKKAIPVLGGVVGGTLTFVTFKPCCNKLKATLRDTMLSNPEEATKDEIVDVISENIIDGEEIEAEVLEDILSEDDFDITELSDTDE